MSQAEWAVTVGRHRIAIACAAEVTAAVCVCMLLRTCVYACVRTPVHTCMYARVRTPVHTCMCVCACVMCLQHTIKYLTQADNNNN